MNPKPPLKPQRLRLLGLQRKGKKSAGVSAGDGFTLVELLVAGVISVVVILVAWSGLVSAMNMSQVSQSRVARQTELNRALDFITNEIRMAQSLNQTIASASSAGVPSTPANLSNVVTTAGVNLSALGNYGTLALYLERPITNAPAICPVGGPNAGSPPPSPANFDPIVYDIRPSPSGWLPPMTLTRYGRVPQADGSINPCSNPVSSDPMIDALSQTMKQTPTCSGSLNGNGGFYSCINGPQATLFLQSDVTNAEVKQVSTTVSSRLVKIVPPQPSTSMTLTMNQASNTVALGWTKANTSLLGYYQLNKSVSGPSTPAYTQSYLVSSFSTNYTDDITPIASGQNVCYEVDAVTLLFFKIANTNQQCLVK